MQHLLLTTAHSYLRTLVQSYCSHDALGNSRPACVNVCVVCMWMGVYGGWECVGVLVGWWLYNSKNVKYLCKLACHAPCPSLTGNCSIECRICCCISCREIYQPLLHQTNMHTGRSQCHTHQTNTHTLGDLPTINMPSKSNTKGVSPKLASTISPGVCSPTVGYRSRPA